MKRLRDENPPEMHKKRRTEAPEVPSDIQDMEIPLEDMGHVIVFKRGDRVGARRRLRSSRHPAVAVLVRVGHTKPITKVGPVTDP